MSYQRQYVINQCNEQRAWDAQAIIEIREGDTCQYLEGLFHWGSMSLRNVYF